MNADGSDFRSITENEYSVAGEPSWSPDGTQIVFQLDGVIQVMNADGTGSYLTGQQGEAPSFGPTTLESASSD